MYGDLLGWIEVDSPEFLSNNFAEGGQPCGIDFVCCMKTSPFILRHSVIYTQ